MTDDEALIELLHFLRLHDYRFTTVTPATHARVLSRTQKGQPGLRDILGWNRSFSKVDLEPLLLGLLERAGALEGHGDGRLVSKVRVASLDDLLFLHSAFPTEDRDAVFFGPDTYRFIQFINQQLPTIGPVRQVVDMGAGSGAGGISLVRNLNPANVTLVDVNDAALKYAGINAAAAGVKVALLNSDRLPADADFVIANPPYIMDEQSRQYRAGGELLGGAVTLDWAKQFLAKAASGRTMLLYTGAAYTGGRSPLLAALRDRSRAAGADITVEELDPDVFGEELDCAPYQAVERIAAVGVRIDY